MKTVVSAIEKGKCAVAAGAAVLRDGSVMAELTKRANMPSMALSGPTVSPVQALSFDAVFRATAVAGGVVVIVDPQAADMPGVQKLGDFIRDGQHKPTIVVVAQQYNAFSFMGPLRGLKVEHLKERYAKFFKSLPDAPELELPEGLDAAVAEKKAKKKKSGPEAPRFAFVGRDEEVAAMGELLTSGGPIVVSGARGMGRTQLAEHAIAASGLTRLPDYSIGWGNGFDGLVSLLAEACAQVGVTGLKDAVIAKAKPLAIIEAAMASLTEATALEGSVFMIHDLQVAAGRAGDFFRKSRLELLLQALVSNTYGLRIVFISTHQPVLHRESANQALRRVEVTGLKGRFLREIFEAYKAPEFPRERFGPMNDRIHGSPLAARLYAIAVRDRQDGIKLTEDIKFLAESEPGETKRLSKHIERRLEKLGPDERRALAIICHFRVPVGGDVLSDMDISRKVRTQLLSLGLLDMVGTLENKKYRAHPLVRAAVPRRAASDFDVYKIIAQVMGTRANKAEGIEKVALAHWSTWAAELGRDSRAAFRSDYIDDDAFLDSVTALVRRKEPRVDMADKMLRAVIENNPSNSDAHLLLIELMSRGNAPKQMMADGIEAALAQAPVPEVFHEATTFWLRQRARAKAVAVLEAGVAAVPNDSRLKARLASLLLREGRRPEAIDLLRTAMEQDPMLPDAYGLLGMAKLDEGVDAIGEAEELIREAVRLAPEDEVQVSRLASLLMERARISELDQQAALWDEAHKLLEDSIKGDKKSPHVLLLLAQLVRERKGDLERARWFVNQAKKQVDRRSDRRHRIRLEMARIDLAAGELDTAEKALRELTERDGANAEVFATLAELLIARELMVPAHAEYMRARERTSKTSIARLAYETELTRLAALIEAQAHALVNGPVATDAAPTEEAPVVARGTVIRRRADVEAEQTAAAVVAADVPAAEPAANVETVEAAAADVEVAADSVEVAVSDVEVTASEAEVTVAPVVPVVNNDSEKHASE